MEKILIFRIGTYYLAVPEQFIAKMGKLKDSFVITPSNFEQWNIIPLHRYFGYPDFPNNRDFIITLSENKGVLICDELVKIIKFNVNLKDSNFSEIDTQYGKILLIDAPNISENDIKRYLGLPISTQSEQIKPGNAIFPMVKNYNKEQKNQDTKKSNQAFPITKDKTENRGYEVGSTTHGEIQGTNIESSENGDTLTDVKNNENIQKTPKEKTNKIDSEKKKLIEKEELHEVEEDITPVKKGFYQVEDNTESDLLAGEFIEDENNDSLTELSHEQEQDIPQGDEESSQFLTDKEYSSNNEEMLLDSEGEDFGYDEENEITGNQLDIEKKIHVDNNFENSIHGKVAKNEKVEMQIPLIIDSEVEKQEISEEEVENIDIFTDYDEIGETEEIEEAEEFIAPDSLDTEQWKEEDDELFVVDRDKGEEDVIRNNFHIFNLDEHFSEKPADEPASKDFITLDTLLDTDIARDLQNNINEKKKLKNLTEPGISKIDFDFESSDTNNSYDVDVIVDVDSFENGMLKKDFNFNKPELKLDKAALFVTGSGDKAVIKDASKSKGSKEHNHDKTAFKNNMGEDDDDESDCRTDGFERESLRDKQKMNGNDYDDHNLNEDNAESDTENSEKIDEERPGLEDDSTISGAFKQAMEHSKMENAFSDVFFDPADHVNFNKDSLNESKDNALSDYESFFENNQEETLANNFQENEKEIENFDFLESDISKDYNGLVKDNFDQNPLFEKQKDKIVSRNEDIRTDSKDETGLEDEEKNFSKQSSDDGYSKSSRTEIDNEKKSYVDERDDAIEKIRREIMSAREQLGEEEKTNVELLKKVLKNQKEKIEEKKESKDNFFDKKKKLVKKTVKTTTKTTKKKSLHLLISEFFSSAAFKIALILIAVFVLSILGVYFFEHTSNEQFKDIWDTFWYTIVTFTTVGYGDKYPTTFGGQIVGILMMFVGVTLFGVISGRIASYLVDLQIRRGKGLVKLQRLTKHFIICGWRKDFNIVLDEILRANKGISNDEIVLINDIPIEQMESIMSDDKYKGINYIRGDFLEEAVLKRANIEKATKVLILADTSQGYSAQEADARTVMAAITMESINKNIYVAAELLDEKFERYLKLAHVEEIILSREYSRRLLASASAASGMSHIVTELISTQGHKGITTEDIPEEFTGDTFGSLSMFFLDRDGSILVGILENTGNFYERKKEALLEAQKTPDISKLVKNLKTVKSLQANMPIINPGGDYTIKEHSRAILIEGISKADKEAILGS